MQIAVIVVNYGTSDLTLEAVQSVLERTHKGHDVEVHLVDNASPENDAERFTLAKKERDWGDRVTLWLEKKNHGFGRGNNLVLKALAARETPPEYVFLLNPDARLENEALSILVETLEAHPEAGAVGAGILEPPDNKMVTACFRYPTALGEIDRVIGFGPLSRLIGNRRALPADTPPGEVDWVAGACVLFRFHALQKVGFFDPGFFLYFEEVDLMLRLDKAGWRTRYQPKALVVHAAGASTNVQSGALDRRRRPDFVYRSWRRYFTKSHGRVFALATAAGMTGGVAVGRLLAILRRRPSTRQPLFFFRDQWRYVLAPLMGLREDPGYEFRESDVQL